MYIQPGDILKSYGLSEETVTKGRGVYLCKEHTPPLALVPFYGSKERGEFLRNVLLYCESQGYQVERIQMTNEGEAVAKDVSGGRYILKEYVDGVECNVRRELDLYQAMEALARLHNLLVGYQGEIPPNLIAAQIPCATMYEKRYRQLIRTRNYLVKKKHKSEFERLFYNKSTEFLKQAQTATEQMNALAPLGGMLCHGDFNQHQVLFGREPVIINLERLSFEHSLYDFAPFYRKMLEKTDWDENIGIKMLESYMAFRPLGQLEKQYLYHILLFPEKFWKLANHYANARKTWLGKKEEEKLFALVEQEPKRLAFLNKLFSFIG